jgi:urea carboxylase-associated protein 2
MQTLEHTRDNPPADNPVDVIEHWRRFSPDLAGTPLLWSDTVPGGGHWSAILPRGSRLRLVALDPHVNASLVCYHARLLSERYCLPDTLKAQHTAHLTRGHVLMSDMGRSLASIVADSVGWHDPLGGVLCTPRLHAKYGEARYQTHRNAMFRSGEDGLLIEIGKYGLGKRDLVAPVNFFSKVSVDGEGRFHFDDAPQARHAAVELRFDMDTLVAWSTAPHPLDPRPDYAPGKLGLVAWRDAPASADDVCARFRPENARALYNSAQFYL